MKYKQRDELVAGLRDLADFLESDRGIQLPLVYPRVELGQYFYESTEERKDGCKKKMIAAAKALGSSEKQYLGSSFALKKMFGERVHIRFSTEREAVCTKRVVGTKQVQKSRYVDIPGEFDTQEVVEWDCTEPLLATTE